MAALDKGIEPRLAIEEASGTYGRFEESTNVVNPRQH